MVGRRKWWQAARHIGSETLLVMDPTDVRKPYA
jgi:hypothetical protein